MNRALIILFLAVSTQLWAQTLEEDLIQYVKLDNQSSVGVRSRFDKVIAVIGTEGSSSEMKLLKRTYRLVREEFLEKYKVHASLGETLESGTYDCLTATALYAATLERLHIRYDIMETNYHIFIMVYTTRGTVLLEATDPVNGLVTGADEIHDHLTSYHLQQPTLPSNRVLNNYSFEIFRSISNHGLIGLLHFNQSARAFNEGDYLRSAQLLHQAQSWYDTPRCETLGNLLLRAVEASQMDAKSRLECLSLLKHQSPETPIATIFED